MSSTAEQYVSDLDTSSYDLPTTFFGSTYGYDRGNTPGWTDYVQDFFTGEDSKQRYQNYLTNKEREYELAKLNDARAYETWYDSTKYQRAVKDLKAAGLNPWLALQSGFSGNGTSSVGTTSSAKSKLVDRKSNNVLGALLLAAAKIISTVL